MQSIVIAIKSYESTYGVLPFSIATEKTVPMDASEYDTMMDVLTNIDGNNNSRGIRFLDVPEGYTANGYVDPWNNDYNIFLDTNYDGQIVAGSPISETLYGTVFIYSDGTGDSAADYVYSWK